MKACAYCGRENQDDATHCAECGTAEFAPAIPPTPPEKFGPVIGRRTKAIFVVTAMVLFLILVLILRFGGSAHPPTVRVAVSFPGTPTLTSTGLSFVVSNETDSMIVYLACPPQVKSNDVWIDGPRPPGPWRMLTLTGNQTVTLMVAAPGRGGLCRVPVLWGYQPKLSYWRWAKHWVLSLVGRNRGINLETYTNFSAEIRLP